MKLNDTNKEILACKIVERMDMDACIETCIDNILRYWKEEPERLQQDIIDYWEVE